MGVYDGLNSYSCIVLGLSGLWTMRRGGVQQHKSGRSMENRHLGGLLSAWWETKRRRARDFVSVWCLGILFAICDNFFFKGEGWLGCILWLVYWLASPVWCWSGVDGILLLLLGMCWFLFSFKFCYWWVAYPLLPPVTKSDGDICLVWRTKVFVFFLSVHTFFSLSFSTESWW